MDSQSSSEPVAPDDPDHDISQASSTPIASDSTAVAAPLHHGPQLEWIDWAVRLLVCAVAVAALASQLIPRASATDNDGLLSLVILAGLIVIYLLGSIEPIARRLYASAQGNPIGMVFPPLLLLIPFIVLGRSTPRFDAGDVLTAAMLLFLPVALALINSPRLRWGDISTGLVAVAMPLVAPILRSEPITATDGLLRAGAFALPVLLLVLTTRRQKERLNFLFLCAVLTLWYSIEFKAFPDFSLPGEAAQMSYFQLAAICTFLYVLAIAGRFGRLGLSFKPSPRGVSIVASNLAIFALIAAPIGLVTGFFKPGLAPASLGEALARAFSIYLTIALPEEILFRGTLLNYLSDTLQWRQAPAVIALSALVFGAAHLNNPPNVGWYFVLATIAGVFYARTYLATKNIAAAAALHTAVDWLWAMVFAG